MRSGACVFIPQVKREEGCESPAVTPLYTLSLLSICHWIFSIREGAEQAVKPSQKTCLNV